MKGTGKECAVVARRDAGTAKANARFAEFVSRVARGAKARLAKTVEKAGKCMCGVVCPVGSANGLAQTLRAAGYDVTVTPKKEPPTAAAEPAQADEPKAEAWKPSRAEPMPRMEQTREAVHGCRWGDPMMDAVLQELGLAKDPMRIASNHGRHFGFFRLDRVKFCRLLGLRAAEMDRATGRWTDSASSEEIDKACAERFGADSAVTKFWRAQCVGFNPDLIKNNNKTKNRKVKK